MEQIISKKNDTLRSNDPEVLVHSTDMDSWISIAKSKKIRACFFIKGKRESRLHGNDEIAQYLLNEPDEYQKYAMLGPYDSCTELVVAAFQKRDFIFDEKNRYEPGSRIYDKSIHQI